jgi:hypothetical protein
MKLYVHEVGLETKNWTSGFRKEQKSIDSTGLRMKSFKNLMKQLLCVTRLKLGSD